MFGMNKNNFVQFLNNYSSLRTLNLFSKLFCAFLVFTLFSLTFLSCMKYFLHEVWITTVHLKKFKETRGTRVAQCLSPFQWILCIPVIRSTDTLTSYITLFWMEHYEITVSKETEHWSFERGAGDKSFQFKNLLSHTLSWKSFQTTILKHNYFWWYCLKW